MAQYAIIYDKGVNEGVNEGDNEGDNEGVWSNELIPFNHRILRGPCPVVMPEDDEAPWKTKLRELIQLANDLDILVDYYDYYDDDGNCYYIQYIPSVENILRFKYAEWKSAYPYNYWDEETTETALAIVRSIDTVHDLYTWLQA